MDESEIKGRQLNALVGGAIRGLVESGADDEAVGAFALSYRMKAAKILGQPQEALNPPDLAEVIKAAVCQALSEGVSTPPRSRKQNDHFTVLIAGQKTSVTIHKDIVAKLVELKGSRSKASKFVRDVAKDVPLTAPSKSGWIEDRINTLLNFGDKTQGNESAARH